MKLEPENPKLENLEKAVSASDEGTCAPPRDADEAMKALAGTDGQTIEIDEETNKRLLRTIDWHLIPLMCIINAMGILDSMPPKPDMLWGSC